MIVPMWTRTRGMAHFSVTVVLPPDCLSSIARLPVPYADEEQQVVRGRPDGGADVEAPVGPVRVTPVQVRPLDGSMPAIRSPPKITSCAWPSTSMSRGDAGECSTSPAFQTRAPVAD